MLKAIKSNQKILLAIIAVGLLLRLLIAPFSAHADLAYYEANAGVFSLDKLDIYSFLQKNNACIGASNSCWGYPYLTYPFFGLVHHAIQVFVPAIGEWSRSLLANIASQQTDFFAFKDINLILFLLKIPYLLFDVGIALLLMKFFEKESEKKLALVVWSINPIAIYATYAFGAFDIIPAFFALLAVYFAKKNKLVYSMIALGIGAGFKHYPFFLLIPILLCFESKWIEKIKLALICAITYLISALPVLFSEGFWRNVWFSPVAGSKMSIPLTKAFLKIGVDASFLPKEIPTFLIAYAIIIGLILLKPKQISLEKSVLLILVSLFAFTTAIASPHYLVWLLPFLVLFVNKNNLMAYLAIICAYALILLRAGSALTTQLLAPLNAQLATQWSIALDSVVKPNLVIFALTQILFSLALLWFARSVLQKEIQVYSKTLFSKKSRQ